MTDQKTHECCEQFRLALKNGTDAGGYGPAIGASETQHWWTIGGIREPIKFCPWCGAVLPTEGEEIESTAYRQLMDAITSVGAGGPVLTSEPSVVLECLKSMG